jgi:hypothetical protein
MDKLLFDKKLEPIGRMRRKWRGTDSAEDYIFEAHYREPTCPDCTELEFVLKPKGWVRKCVICREKTIVKTITESV